MHTTRTALACLLAALLLTPLAAQAASRVVATGLCADQWLLAAAPTEQIAGLSRQAARSKNSSRKPRRWSFRWAPGSAFRRAR